MQISDAEAVVMDVLWKRSPLSADEVVMALSSRQDWQDATVIPGETIFLQSVAPSKDCRDFKISLKEAN